jgi:hypothetical protein
LTNWNATTKATTASSTAGPTTTRRSRNERFGVPEPLGPPRRRQLVTAASSRRFRSSWSYTWCGVRVYRRPLPQSTVVSNPGSSFDQSNPLTYGPGFRCVVVGSSEKGARSGASSSGTKGRRLRSASAAASRGRDQWTASEGRDNLSNQHVTRDDSGDSREVTVSRRLTDRTGARTDTADTWCQDRHCRLFAWTLGARTDTADFSREGGHRSRSDGRSSSGSARAHER